MAFPAYSMRLKWAPDIPFVSVACHNMVALLLGWWGRRPSKGGAGSPVRACKALVQPPAAFLLSLFFISSIWSVD